MRFVSFLQRLGYLVFLQVLLLPCLAYSTFHVSLGHNFGFSFASFCYCCSYTYFILVGPFCFGLFVFHSAPGADFVWNKIFLFVPAVRDRSTPGSPPRFSSLFNVKSLGFKVVTVPVYSPVNCYRCGLPGHFSRACGGECGRGNYRRWQMIKVLCCKAMGRVFSLPVFCTPYTLARFS